VNGKRYCERGIYRTSLSFRSSPPVLIHTISLGIATFAPTSSCDFLHFLDPTMAATQEVISPQARATEHIAAHPLCPLTASEISNTAQLIKKLWPSNVDIRFKVITLEEPQKKHFVPYLDAEHAGRTLPCIDRRAFVAYYLRNTVRFLSYIQGGSCAELLRRTNSTKLSSTSRLRLLRPMFALAPISMATGIIQKS
jgi:Copper amine oxidase, N2 domain